MNTPCLPSNSCWRFESFFLLFLNHSPPPVITCSIARCLFLRFNLRHIYTKWYHTPYFILSSNSKNSQLKVIISIFGFCIIPIARRPLQDYSLHSENKPLNVLLAIFNDPSHLLLSTPPMPILDKRTAPRKKCQMPKFLFFTPFIETPILCLFT